MRRGKRSRRPGAGETFGSGRGFTLVEALVAMVLVSTVGYAVFALINSHYISFRRVRDAQQKIALERSVLEVAQKINPVEEPTGHMDLGEYRLVWESDNVKKSRSSVSGNGLEVGVFRVEFELQQQSDTVLTLELLLMGYDSP